MAGGDTCRRILAAAEDLVIRDGVAKLTLEAAAHEAGVSKGGILYHFGTRAALVSAMVERLLESFEEDLARYGAHRGRPGDFTRAWVRATLAPEAGERDRRLGAALLAGVASEGELLGPLRERYDSWQHAIDKDGLDKDLATLLRLAADGLWFSDLFSLAPVSGRRRQAVGRRLLEMTETTSVPLRRDEEAGES